MRKVPRTATSVKGRKVLNSLIIVYFLGRVPGDSTPSFLKATWSKRVNCLPGHVTKRILGHIVSKNKFKCLANGVNAHEQRTLAESHPS